MLTREKFTHNGTEYVVVINDTSGSVIAIEKHIPVVNAMQPHTRKTKLRGDRRYEVFHAFIAHTYSIT